MNQVLVGFDTDLFWEALTSGPYWKGALLALALTVVSLAVAVVLGFLLALGRMSRRRSVRSFCATYNWLFRATPTLLQLIFIWDALPQLWPVFAGSWFTPFLAAFIALSLNEAAYMNCTTLSKASASHFRRSEATIVFVSPFPFEAEACKPTPETFKKQVRPSQQQVLALHCAP